jgi:hypothetical protein
VQNEARSRRPSIITEDMIDGIGAHVRENRRFSVRF